MHDPELQRGVVSNVSKQCSAVYFFSVLHAVDGHDFRMFVDVIENSIFPDSKPVSFDAFEFFGLMLPGLFGK